MTFSPGPASFIRGPKSASPSNTRGGSRVPEWGPLGSVRGALSNERPYRDLRNVDANYPFERSHRFAGIQPNSGFGDYSRLSCGVGDTQLGPRPGSRRGWLLARGTPAELARVPRVRAEFRPGRPLAFELQRRGDTQLGAGFCGDLQQRSAPTLAIMRRRREGTNWPRSLSFRR